MRQRFNDGSIGLKAREGFGGFSPEGDAGFRMKREGKPENFCHNIKVLRPHETI